MRKGVTQSEWVSPDEEGLGCHEHLSSQIFRQTGQSGINQRKNGTNILIKRRLDRTPSPQHRITIKRLRKTPLLPLLEVRTGGLGIKCEIGIGILKTNKLWQLSINATAAKLEEKSLSPLMGYAFGI